MFRLGLLWNYTHVCSESCQHRLQTLWFSMGDKPYPQFICGLKDSSPPRSERAPLPWGLRSKSVALYCRTSAVSLWESLQFPMLLGSSSALMWHERDTVSMYWYHSWQINTVTETKHSRSVHIKGSNCSDNISKELTLVLHSNGFIIHINIQKLLSM